MNYRNILTGIALMLAVLLCVVSVAKAAENDADRTLSPYFFVKSDSPGVDQLPLKSTSATVRISGVIADVTVRQVYRNTGSRTLEAVYVFPGSTRAAVYGMTMTIGERVLVAKIREREQARQEYEQARREGRTASLLEQERPNVFTMNVANIQPNDEIVVELKYTELLVPTDGTYEFVYPAVVGPRYTTTPAAGAPATEQFTASPYLQQGAQAPYAFDLKTSIAAGMPIRDISSPSHKLITTHNDLNSAEVALDPAGGNGGNRDYVLRYRLAGDAIQSGMLLWQGDTENFFLMMVQPPARVTPAQIPAREYVFIVDVSGSMHGFPLNISKQLMRDLLTGLRPQDRFNVMLFSGGNTVLAEQSLPVTEENIARAINAIDNEHGRGGTELLPALKRALALPRPDGMSRNVVIVTDGYVSVEREAFDLIRNNLGKANMYAFGIGSGVNRYIIEGIARMGQGEPFVITRREDAAAHADTFRRYIESPVLTGISVTFPGFDAYDIEPVSIPDVLAQRPLVVFGKWRGEVKGEAVVTGTSGHGAFSERLRLSEYRPRTDNSALRYLWARQRIAILDDYNRAEARAELKQEVTALGLQYNLMTQYTSFVAIDSIVRRNENGELVTVQQALPLPEGVENTAVGAAAPSFYGGAPSRPVYLSPQALRTNAMAPAPVSEALKDETADIAVPPPAGPLADSISIVALTVDNPSISLPRLQARFVAALQQLLPAQPAAISGDGQQVKVTLVIGTDGKVTAANLIESALDAATTQQLLQAISGWKFDGLTLRRPATVQLTLAVW